jgi:hypothetical protein
LTLRPGEIQKADFTKVTLGGYANDDIVGKSSPTRRRLAIESEPDNATGAVARDPYGDVIPRDFVFIERDGKRHRGYRQRIG